MVLLGLHTFITVVIPGDFIRRLQFFTLDSERYLLFFKINTCFKILTIRSFRSSCSLLPLNMWHNCVIGRVTVGIHSIVLTVAAHLLACGKHKLV